MTLDPLFTFNPDLDDVSNQHSAERVIECSPSVFQFEAPWRIELPQGGVIRGTAQDTGTWPAALGDLSPNARIVRTSSSGSGKVVEDNLGDITQALDSYNESVPKPAASPESSSGGGCSVASGDGGFAVALVAAALGVVALRRRRR
jgi:MYXO-CTERM domain-containing protein